MDILKNIGDNFKQHKKIYLVIIVLIAFLGFLYGYSKFFEKPENIIDHTSFGKVDNKDLEKTISKKSDLGKDLPYAEEIIKKISELENKNTDNNEIDYFNVIHDTYGEEVARLYEAGLIPSSSLTESENTQIILSGNAFLKKEDTNYFGAEYIKLTRNFIDSLGKFSPDATLNPQPVYPVVSYDEVDFFNTVSVLENKKIKINGVFLENIGELTEEDSIEDVILLGHHRLGNSFKDIQTIEEANAKFSHEYILTINFLIKNNMKISDIKKELQDLKLGENNIEFLDINNLGEEYKESISSTVNQLSFLEMEKGSDYEIASFSVLQARFAIPVEQDVFTTSNYLSLDEQKIELSSKGTIAYTNNMLYNNYTF